MDCANGLKRGSRVITEFTEESDQYLQSKIQDHRQMLKEAFPDFKLRPKHHYIEHYPDLIRLFGPLVHLWTMRFEGKHSFFKRVVHDTQNFKNVLKTLSSQCLRIIQTSPASIKCLLCTGINASRCCKDIC